MFISVDNNFQGQLSGFKLPWEFTLHYLFTLHPSIYTVQIIISFTLYFSLRLVSITSMPFRSGEPENC
jgi:hypothetical protein